MFPPRRWPEPFAGADRRLAQRLSELAPLAIAEPRTWIRPESSDAREAVLLLEGEVEVRRDGHLLSIVEAPATLGLRALLASGAPSPSLRALTGVTFARLSRSAWESLGGFNPALPALAMRYLCAELQSCEEEHLTAARAFDDVYLSPGVRLPPPPYSFDDVDLTVLVLRGSADRLSGALPPGLLPVPAIGDRYLVLVADVKRARFAESIRADEFRYREAIPLVPCLSTRGTFGAFAPEVYPDAYHAIVLGREIHGFPKRHARTWIRERSLHVASGGECILRASWTEREPMSAESFGDAFVGALAPGGAEGTWLGRGFGAALAWGERDPVARVPPLRTFVRKRIPAADAPDRPAIDELVEVPFVLHFLGGFSRLQSPRVSMPFGGGFFHGEAVAALAARVGFGLDRGRVLRSYVDRDGPAESLLGGLLHRALGPRASGAR